MQQPSNPFNLPMMLMFLESRNCHLVHSLDFDIVSVANTEHEAWEKARLAVKDYVEFGLRQGLARLHRIFRPTRILGQDYTRHELVHTKPIMIANIEKK